MSTVLVNFICSTIMSVMGLIVVKNISGSQKKIMTLRSQILMIILIVIPMFLHTDEYNALYTPMVYLFTIFIYKEILDISWFKSTISCGIMLLFLFLLDVLTVGITTFIVPMNVARTIWYYNITINTLFFIINIVFFSNKMIRSKLQIYIRKLETKKAFKIVLSIVLVLIVLATITYTLTQQVKINKIFTTNYIIFFVFFVLLIILLSERNSYEKLSDEYEGLFKYIQIFEDWIENEQLTRHEYKNQLAVLRSLTKEKKVKDKIDSINSDFINVDNKMIDQLKCLPNNGIKGLLYYKISVARKNKINLSIDVDKSSHFILSKLNEDNLKVITKLLGVYLDNAIEAALDTRKKIVSIEIYAINNEVKFVISNSYNNKNDISNRNKKGVSTKGVGRGNGLYFASKLMTMNNWISDKQEIIGSYYIQSIIIKK